HFRYPRHRRSDRARRPHAGPVQAAGAHRRGTPQHDPAPARRQRHHDPSGIRRALSAHQSAGAMTSRETAVDLPELSRTKWRQHAVTAGRIGLAVLLLVAWKLGADLAGPVYAADPFKVFERIVGDTLS